MPVDMSNPQGFNKFWDDIQTAFEAVAVDDHLDGGNLDPVNDHVTGPVTEDTLASQFSYPIVWTVFQNHSPAYANTVEDSGTMQAQVVVFATDRDPDTAYDKARTLGGRIVNNVEADRALTGGGTYSNMAASTWLTNFQMDFMATAGGETRSQMKFCQMLFDIEVERNYR